MAETLLTPPRFKVERRQYTDPPAEPIDRYVVVHPGAVVMVPILEDGRIVLIRQVRQAVDRDLWELPAGTLEPGEPPRQAARRELEEETGYRAETLDPLIRFYTTPGICTEIMHAFVAGGLTQVGQKLERGERIDVRPLPETQVVALMQRGEIVDGKTLATLGFFFLNATNRSAVN